MFPLFLIHLGLSLLLFWGINFIGKHIPANFGYYQLSTFKTPEESPAFNFLIRVISPAIYLILVSTVFYSFGLDKYTHNIYLVSIYYVLFRALFNISLNRSTLINWPKYILYSCSIVALCFFTYKKFITTKSNILPDFNNIANELWLIIIIFLYNVINNIQVSGEAAANRIEKYVESQFNLVNRKYSNIILKETQNQRIRQIALAIIIFESFNRPKIYRIFEYIIHFFIRKPHTLGVMQVSSSKFITDRKSVTLGVQKLLRDFNELNERYKNDTENEDFLDYKEDQYQRLLIESFNPDLIYSSEVLQLADDINKKYFSNAPRLLFRNAGK